MAEFELPAGTTPAGPTVDFCGETFRLEAEPNEFALMQWSDAAENVDDNSVAAYGATFRLLQAAIHADDWPRFKQTAFTNKATVVSLMPVAFAVFQAATERPTERPSVSSDGPEPTPLRSVSAPADAAMDQLSGRPDMQLAFQRTLTAVKAASA